MSKFGSLLSKITETHYQDFIAAGGKEFTVTIRVAVALHVPLDTVTVQVVVLVGEKVAAALLPPLLFQV